MKRDINHEPIIINLAKEIPLITYETKFFVFISYFEKYSYSNGRIGHTYNIIFSYLSIKVN